VGAGSLRPWGPNFFLFGFRGGRQRGRDFSCSHRVGQSWTFICINYIKGGAQGSTSVLLLGSAPCFKTNCDGPIKVVPSTHKKLCHAPQLINKKDEYIYLNILTDPLSCGLSCFICEQANLWWEPLSCRDYTLYTFCKGHRTRMPGQISLGLLICSHQFRQIMIQGQFAGMERVSWLLRCRHRRTACAKTTCKYTNYI
jgi:hypothetical protein